MHPKDDDGMANSVDPDQTASSEAVYLSVPIHRICTVLQYKMNDEQHEGLRPFQQYVIYIKKMEGR